MKIELSDLNNGSVFIGDKLNVRTKFKFEENTSILWSGIKLITQPPCLKELQVSKEEIFSMGHFEAGEYIRERALSIKNNVVPTIKNRNLEYEIKLIIRQPHPTNPDDDLVINKSQKVEIKSRDLSSQVNQSNPISFSISGLNVLLNKDVFKPGETVKISFTSEVLKQIEVRLLQTANLVCYCDAYGQTCRKVEELPPAIAGDSKTTDIEKGFLLLKIPEIAEPTHNYIWEPTEKEYWGFKFGDYTKWALLIIGKKKSEYGREPITFELPITIVSKPPREYKKEADLFAETPTAAPSLFDGVSSKFQKIYKITSIDSDIEKYILKIKNTSKESLKGVTIKVSGLQEGLFETAPNLAGFDNWKPNEEKEVIFQSKQDISALITLLEDNSQKKIRIQTPVASNFF
ncbi:MAG: hypothetical protein ACXACC_05475 [Promethearchaeota archaeon]|jgi:hypothetical protein